MEKQEFLKTLKWLEGQMQGFHDAQYRLAVVRGFFRGTDKDKTFTASQISQILELAAKE